MVDPPPLPPSYGGKEGEEGTPPPLRGGKGVVVRREGGTPTPPPPRGGKLGYSSYVDHMLDPPLIFPESSEIAISEISRFFVDFPI